MVGLVYDRGNVVLAPNASHGPLARYEGIRIRIGNAAPRCFIAPLGRGRRYARHV